MAKRRTRGDGKGQGRGQKGGAEVFHDTVSLSSVRGSRPRAWAQKAVYRGKNQEMRLSLRFVAQLPKLWNTCTMTMSRPTVMNMMSVW